MCVPGAGCAPTPAQVRPGATNVSVTRHASRVTRDEQSEAGVLAAAVRCCCMHIYIHPRVLNFGEARPLVSEDVIRGVNLPVSNICLCTCRINVGPLFRSLSSLSLSPYLKMVLIHDAQFQTAHGLPDIELGAQARRQGQQLLHERILIRLTRLGRATLSNGGACRFQLMESLCTPASDLTGCSLLLVSSIAHLSQHSRSNLRLCL